MVEFFRYIPSQKKYYVTEICVFFPLRIVIAAFISARFFFSYYRLNLIYKYIIQILRG